MVRKRSRKAAHAIEAKRGDHFVREFLGADVGEAQRRIPLLERVADRLHQMGLAQPHSTVEEKRVIGLRGLLGDGLSGGMCELIRAANDETFKSVARIQLMADRIEIEARLGRRNASVASCSEHR